MLVETARLWCDLGFYSQKDDNKFCIHGVTGPDEYTAIVNNNTFTNLMARENLLYAVKTVENLMQNQPISYAALEHETKLDVSEINEWKKSAENMKIPFDKKLKIHPQDDNFLYRKVWDFKNTPKENYPLLLHYHPLVIYRHQVIKQADIVLAMFLIPDDFTVEQKKLNFDYYEPLTTGDSSLSACIQSIIASEIGFPEKAYDYFKHALLIDRVDVGGNVKDGAHIASMGGAWMSVIYGFAGMKDYNGKLRFNPKIPEHWNRLRFRLTMNNQFFEIDINQETVTYKLLEGSSLVIEHLGKEIKLKPDNPVRLSLKISKKRTKKKVRGVS